MTGQVAAISANHLWAIALGIGLGGAVLAAVLLTVLVSTVDDIDRSVAGLLDVAGKVAANTASIPQLTATAPVLAEINEELIVQESYMNALTDGFGGGS
jgi:hypothetical protein